jgi:hypothetical protein
MRFIVSFESSELSRLCFEVGATWYVLDADGFSRKWLLKPELRHGDVEFEVNRLSFIGAHTTSDELAFYFEQYSSGFMEHFASLLPAPRGYDLQAGQHLCTYLPGSTNASV